MNIKVVTTEAELEQCKDVRRRVFIQEQGVPAGEEFDRFDRLGACVHFAIEDGDKIVGTARLIDLGEGLCKYQRIAVDQSCRGKGAGRALLGKMDVAAIESGFAKVVLDAQLHAIPFYERCGFQVLDATPFYDGGILHNRMGKELS